LQLFQNISYLDLGEGEMGEAVGGAGLLTGVGVARCKRMESRRQILIDILNYHGFISGDSVS
jgi:hypothetical protein